jgi:hypothetical protein
LKGILYTVAAVMLLLCSCGEGPAEPVSALAALPENPLVAIAVVDPCFAVTSIDGYIAEGAPVLGGRFLETTLCAELGVENLETLMTGWGLDPHGTTVFFMEAMTPATMGLASTVVDPDLFFSSLTDLGIAFEESDPIEGIAVRMTAIPSGNLFVTTDRDLLLVAGSRSTLTSMLDRLDPESSGTPIELQRGTFFFSMELASIGPMAASQLAMVRPQILAEMAESGGPGDEMGMQMIGIYFDAISMFLTQTESIESLIVFDAEDIECESYINLVPGSDLASVLFAPVEIVDLTALVPSGNVMVARASVPPSLTIAVVNAVTGAMGLTYPEEALAEYAEWSQNSAMTIMDDDAGTFFHLVAVYLLPEGTGIDEVRSVYQSQLDFTTDMMGQMQGMMEFTLRDSVYSGREFVVFEMSMDPSAMEFEGAEMPENSFPEMEFTTWMTVADGILWMEMANEPAVVIDLLDGTYEGTMADATPIFAEAADAEFALAFNLDAYLRMMLGLVGEQVDISALPESPVWLNSWVEIMPDECRIIKRDLLSGMDLARMIGNYIPVFSAM